MARGVQCFCGALALVSTMLLTCSVGRADLTHRYSFTSDANDSVGTAHGTPYSQSLWQSPGVEFEDGQAVLTNDGETQISNDSDPFPSGNPSDEPPGGYIDLPNGLISTMGNQATFETWFTWNGGNWYQRIFDFGTSDGGENYSSGGANNRQIMLVPCGNYSRLAFYLHDSSGYNVVYTDVVMQKGVENHIAVSWDGANDRATVYCDGHAAGCVPGLNFSLEDLIDDNNWLGRSQCPDPMLAGSYDEFRIYNEALSSAQVYKNCQDGADAEFTRVTDVTAAQLTAAPVHRYSFNGDCNDSIGTAHGVLVNNTTNSTYANGKLTLGNDGSQRSGDLSGDTSGDYVDLPNGLISGLEDNATFEFWVTSDSSESTIWERIFDFGISQGGEDISNGGTERSSILGIARSSEKLLRFGHRYGDTDETRYASAPAAMEPGVETHIVCVWDGDNDQMSFYVDGEFMTANETLFDLADLDDVNNWLGRAQYDDLMLQGSYDEFRIYDYALTAEEVLGNYLAGVNKVNTPGNDVPGDSDHDGDVDADDAQALATWWGTATGATWEMGDFNEDGAVNVKDAAILAANWNPDGSGESVASVPEPSVFIAALCGLIALVGFRSKR